MTTSRAHRFVGFGFGPIQGGLFVKEAFESGTFERIVVAEILPDVVAAIRDNGNRYAVNVAHADGVRVVRVEGVEMLNPSVPEERRALVRALAGASDVATCLPSVNIFAAGGANSVAALMSEAWQRAEGPGHPIVYAAENNNHAAEILGEAVQAAGGTAAGRRPAFVNTVIGKMSRVVTDAEEIRALELEPMTPGAPRAFLVEAFNHILIGRPSDPAARPGIGVFEAKSDLLPFEEAKLYGHNAIHALMAYLGWERGHARMSDLAADAFVMETARRAFLDESGAALIRKYAALGDPLFTPGGYRRYAEDLLVRITNPFLADTVERAARDPVRKLGYDDRIFGTMALAHDQGIDPRHMARGAAAGVRFLFGQAETVPDFPPGLRDGSRREPSREQAAAALRWLWSGHAAPLADTLIDDVLGARDATTT